MRTVAPRLLTVIRQQVLGQTAEDAKKFKEFTFSALRIKEDPSGTKKGVTRQGTAGAARDGDGGAMPPAAADPDQEDRPAVGRTRSMQREGDDEDLEFTVYDLIAIGPKLATKAFVTLVNVFPLTPILIAMRPVNAALIGESSAPPLHVLLRESPPSTAGGVVTHDSFTCNHWVRSCGALARTSMSVSPCVAGTPHKLLKAAVS